MTPLERFEQFYIPEPNSGCWLWTGCCSGPTPYGNFSFEGRGMRAHRFSYEIKNGPIPYGLVLDHLCKNPSCVNPEHLEAVTQRINRERGPLGRFSISCDNGHPRTEENFFFTKRGHRICRVCRRERNKQWKGRRRAKQNAASA